MKHSVSPQKDINAKKAHDTGTIPYVKPELILLAGRGGEGNAAPGAGTPNAKSVHGFEGRIIPPYPSHGPS